MKTKHNLILALLLLGVTHLSAQGLFEEKKAVPNTENTSKITELKILPEAAEKWKAAQEKIKLDAIERPALDIHSIKKPSLSNVKPIQPIQSVLYDNESLPYFINIDQSEMTDIQATKRFVEVADEFLAEYSSTIGIENADKAFKETSHSIDSKGNVHMRMKQYWNDIEMYASDVVLHMNNKGVYAFNGRYTEEPKNLSPIPDLDSNAAIMKAIDHLVEKENIEIMSHSALSEKIIRDPSPVAELVIYQEDGSFRLAYHIEYSPLVHKHYHYLIDAHSGEVLKKYNDVCYLGPETAQATDLSGTTRTINTWEDGGTYYLLDGSRSMLNLSASNMPDDPIGALLTLDANNADPMSSNFVSNIDHNSSSNNSWNTNPTAVSAHYNVGVAYEYFKDNFNRNSIDGSGGTVYSVINISSNGQDVDNAFWNGGIFYGNGAQLMDDIPRALDIAGHEMAHGVTQNSAGLIYEFQSGALNESFSDVFGAMIDRDDWTMGEEVINSSIIPSGALRDLQNPNNGEAFGTNFWQPKHMNEYQNLPSTTDHGGVHINSGIPNKAFYLFATAVGKETAEQVYYHALTNYLTQQSQFVDCRASVIQSASDLYSSSVANSAAAAFDDVGIVGSGSTGGGSGGGSGPGNDNDFPALVGEEHLLCHYQPSASSSGFLIDGEASTGVVTQFTTQEALAKVSVVDNGSIGFFVGDDNHIYNLDLTAGNPDTTVNQVSTNPEWRKVAISRDGTKLAALTTNNDNTVLIVTSTAQQTFTLTNPSTADNGSGGSNPEYADAMEFSPYGDYLMYDALTIISGAGGTNVSSWDIGLLKVWDNGLDDFGDGSIQKVFPPQPSNISIGNATFSKSSPYIVALDYLDSSTSEEYVLAANLISGEAGGIALTNNVIGYPSFSPQDDAIAYSEKKFDGTLHVAFKEVGADKITPVGNAQDAIEPAAWPVWYMQGSRNWQSPLADFSANTTAGSPALTVNFFDESSNTPTEWSWTFEQGTPATSSEQNPIVTFPNNGMWNVSLTVTNPSASNNTESKTDYIHVGPGVNVEEVDLNQVMISNHPNPFKGETVIRVQLAKATEVQIGLYDIAGKKVQDIFTGLIDSGNQTFDLSTKGISAGIYFIELTSEEYTLSTKAIVQE